MPSIQLQDLIPPLLVKALGRMRARASRTSHGNQRAFATYDEAAAGCAGRGYQTDDLVEVIFRKTEAYRARCGGPEGATVGLPEALMLAAVGMAVERAPDVVRVLDFGGACGAHYFLARALFQWPLRIDWRVVETPAMTARAQALASDELRFFTSIAEAQDEPGRIDVVHSSSALQYTADPYQALEAMLDLAARHIVLTRLGLTLAAAARIAVQESRLADNGPGPMPAGLRVANGWARYPVTFLPQSAFESQLARRHAIMVNVPDASVFGAGQAGLTGRAYIAQAKAEPVR